MKKAIMFLLTGMLLASLLAMPTLAIEIDEKDFDGNMNDPGCVPITHRLPDTESPIGLFQMIVRISSSCRGPLKSSAETMLATLSMTVQTTSRFSEMALTGPINTKTIRHHGCLKDISTIRTLERIIWERRAPPQKADSLHGTIKPFSLTSPTLKQRQCNSSEELFIM